jgi:Leucine-rich repeat (LRR) protein
MKKLYFVLIGFLVFSCVEAQVINFPDANFKARLLTANSFNDLIAKNLNGNWFSIDSNNDGEIDVSEALNVSELNVSSSNILLFEGISNFINIKILYCSFNPITSLDFSSLTNLEKLYCDSNSQLTSLNLNGLTNLKYIYCSDDNLSVLNLTTLINLEEINLQNNHFSTLNLNGLTNLKVLVFGNNQVTTINVSGLTALTHLYCNNNLLTTLDVSNLINLKALICDSNQITLLGTNNLPSLESLSCNNNQIVNLDLSSFTSNFHYFYCNNNQISSLNLANLINLMYLYCNHNHIATLTASNIGTLQYIECYNNLITSLNVNNLPYLQILNCQNNLITSLDVSNSPILNTLNCSNNLLTSLFIKNGVNEYSLDFSLNPTLQYICADESQISTIETNIVSYNFTNCYVNSYCSFTPGGAFYTIHGNNRYDADNNGCSPADINRPNLQLNITDGVHTSNIISDNSGAYHYDVQAGTQTITPTLENPTYFNVSPTTATVSFPTASSPYTQDFCITAIGTHNDLEVTLLPIGIARPGFDAHYQIVYKNKGTHTQSDTVNLMFNDAVLDYVSAIPTVDLQTVNNLTWNFSNLAPFETRVIDVVLNLNSPMEVPPLNSGDILNYTATVNGLTDETATDNTSTINQAVVNAFDPNYKTCTEGETIAPSSVGKYVHYMIGFENDGTANAENIVVKDMIDTTKYDITTLVPIKGSAPFTTRITNTNQVEFIFQNINLPFAIGSNQGYVAFKIKTKPTLVLGDTFSNTANIYFDYNAPIVTNTATTTIAALVNPEFVFTDYFTLSPIPTKGVLNINTKQDITITSISIYNTLGQVVLVTSNPSNTIDVSNLTTGSYFIKVITDKGSSSGKFIKE